MRQFLPTEQVDAYAAITARRNDLQGHRPLPGGTPVMCPLPVGQNGEPWLGMDPSAPQTWVRPWNPQPGMISYLNFDGAKYQADTPMGGVRRNPMRDRADVPAPRPRWWGKRRSS